MVEKKLIDTFIQLFGEENVEIADKEVDTCRTIEGKIVKIHIITFILFKEIYFKAFINDDITDENLLELKIKNEYSKACDILKDLLLRMDRYFVNEIM